MSVPIENDTFSEYDALHGSLSSQQHCLLVPDAFWAEMDNGGLCIRTYVSGDHLKNDRAIVYFSGDALLRTSKGIRLIGASYLRKSPASILSEITAWKEQANVPVIFVARPGLYGSSGDHNLRRLPQEIEVIDQVLDALKSEHGIKSYILVGQSGGGHVVASLLSRRSDIHAAVISSGLLSVKRVMSVWDKRRSIPGWLLQDSENFVDPVDETLSIQRKPEGGIYILSDPADNIIPFSTQLHYVRRLRNSGIEPHHFYVHAKDNNHHALFPMAQAVSSMVANDASPREILKMLQEEDLKTVE